MSYTHHHPLPSEELPLELPIVEHYEPTGNTEGPLANIESWTNGTKSDGTRFYRETNTMPGWAGSSWYRLRYMDPHNDQNAVAKAKERYWQNVDVYVGGAEHVTRHMIYARFWQKFLYDIGIVNKQEPFEEYKAVGLIMAEDGRKMSKRRGNVINPDDIIDEFGNDTLRVYEMFMGPFNQSVARSTEGVKGVKRFLDKIITCSKKVKKTNVNKSLRTILHQTIKKVSEDIDNFSFNTAIAQLMTIVNTLKGESTIPSKVREPFIILISPFAPHLAEELWEQMGNAFSIFTKASWPTYNQEFLIEDAVDIAIQINGKVRDTISITTSDTKNDVIQQAKKSKKIQKYLTDGTIKKTIYIPAKILNLVIE